MSPMPSVVLHAHLYQPPREDPRTGEIPVEPSAAPFPNWNARILAECYEPLTRTHLLDGEGRILERVPTLEWMSWDAGPTLMDWLLEAAPSVHAAFVEADARSRGRFGFGNALAAPYHHVILPLASRRDKVTEVRWGIRDFRRRFGREPEGMWLPETAVDRETLEVLAAEGIAFTVLAPHQVEVQGGEGPGEEGDRGSGMGGGPGGAESGTPEGGAGASRGAGSPVRIALDGGRSISVFPYDGELSHGIAFGALLRDAEAWVRRIEGRAGEPGRALVAMATDGETFGHHHRWGDLGLAAALVRLAEHRGLRLENFASFLHRHPPAREARLVEPTSWSCAHGVDRWARACGCGAGPEGAAGQGWRPVLREALEGVAGEVHTRFEEVARGAGLDPWVLRDAYALRWRDAVPVREAWLRESGARDVDSVATLLTHLEAEREALRMFTSCGWFFDDIARLEPLQLLRYAARALDLLGLAGGPVESRVRHELARARSVDPARGTGLDLWDAMRRVSPPAMAGEAQGPGAAPGTEPPGEAPRPRTPSVAEPPLLEAVRRFTRMPSPDAAEAVARALEGAGGGGIGWREGDPGGEGDGKAPLEALLRAHPIPPLEEARTRFAAFLERSEAPPSPPVARVAGLLGFAPGFLHPRRRGGTAPVGFVFGIHLHQPVGNFDHVFQDHADRVYLPLLRTLAERELLPLTLHLSGPLLTWLEAAAHPLLDRIGPLVAQGQAELLLSGLHEPVLPALPREERVEQIAWMRERLVRRFGADPRGLWLTERVWEPDLVEDLAQAGVDYTLLDDRHFVVAGHPHAALHRPFRTASGGRSLALLPISERLRYLVPFRPFEALEAHFRALRAEGHPLAVLADDGEKFGGWPGTHAWVWEGGWMDRFVSGMDRLREEGVVELLTGSEAVARTTPGGPVYLPSASYREMEGWSLPPGPALALEAAEHASEGASGGEVAPFLRGGHWRNFLGRYAESARMQQHADLLGRLARERGADQALLQALGRSRCNDPYWHGVFGGLYLAHLREAIWKALAEAEATLRQGEALAVEEVPGPGGVGTELWVHAPAFSALLSPRQGGAVVAWRCLRSGRNLADVLTRRWEAYHRLPSGEAGEGEGDGVEGAEGDGIGVADAPPENRDSAPAGGMASIHEREGLAGTADLPPMDPEVRALTVERILPAGVEEAGYAAGHWDPLRSWATETPHWEVLPPREAGGGGADDRGRGSGGEGTPLRIRFRFSGRGRLEKEVFFTPDGDLEIHYRWDPRDFPRRARFAPEFSLADPSGEGATVQVRCDPEPAERFDYEIRTWSRSESGVETAVQGRAVVPLWPVTLGRASVRIRLPRTGGGG